MIQIQRSSTRFLGWQIKHPNVRSLFGVVSDDVGLHHLKVQLEPSQLLEQLLVT